MALLRAAEVVGRHEGPLCKNDAFVAKIANTHLTKIFMAICALGERLPTSATLLSKKKILGVAVEGY